MSKKTLSIIVLLGIVLSACGGQAQATETPTTVPASATAPPATATPRPSETPAPQESPTPPPTATEVVPTNAADCVNNGSFVSDVTIPDNSSLNAGETFTKTWRVKNTGTCIWWSGYTLDYYSDETMGAPLSVPLKLTNPGETIDISIEMIAPTTNGPHRGNFVIKNPEGKIMQIDQDSRLWVIINVVNAGTGSPTATQSTGTGGNTDGFAKVSCAFTLDSTKVSEVVTAVNAYRAQQNLPAYTVSPQLTLAAQAHANDMACNKLFYHTGSDNSTPQSRVTASGYVASSATENVYGSFPPLTGQGVVTWWATDQGDIRHNENLLSSTYKEIGVGYSFFNNFGFYVLVFAAP